MARFSPFEPRPRLAVALSGGADSMALLALAREWVRDREGDLLALIVDHGLRPGSDREAAEVAGWARALGVGAEVLRWRGPKPASRIQERAREARYALLREACRRAGVLHLLTAHHRDDLVETVALRRMRGSGPRGLAGILPERFLEELRLLRPLLPVPRARLEATRRARGLPRLEDPSNLDPRFARGRLRRAGSLPEAELLAEAAAAARRRADLEAALARFCARRLRFHPTGLLTLSATALGEVSPELAELFLERAAMVAGGALHPPRRRQLAALAAALRHEGEGRRTLAGCIFEIVPEDRRLRIGREPGRVAPPRLCPGGARVLWDRCWWLETEPGSPPVTIGALAALEDGALRRRLFARARGCGLPRWFAAGLPVVLREGRLLLWPL
ncbi:MAG TPA: tRNA lysidine(34) synthetase TilS, partial [Rhodospirillales bacterium]|nr:tRNA lysidine(34) synthetase TilS [Rhodospirillales bacterium]